MCFIYCTHHCIVTVLGEIIADYMVKKVVKFVISTLTWKNNAFSRAISIKMTYT